MGARLDITDDERRERKRAQDRAAHVRRKERGEYFISHGRNDRSESRKDTRPPDHVLAERDNAIRSKMEMDFTSIFNGDPLPGRRAIDRREG